MIKKLIGKKDFKYLVYSAIEKKKQIKKYDGLKERKHLTVITICNAI
jgi:hypothetical protein